MHEAIDVDTMEFIPFCMDTEGAMNEEAVEWMKKCCWASAKLRPGLAKAAAGSLPMYVSLLFRSWRAKLMLVMKKYTAKAILQHNATRFGGDQFKGMLQDISVNPADSLFSN